MRPAQAPDYFKVNYRGINVSYLPVLDGGGMTFGQEFVEVVRNKLGKVDHAFEFCAGPGFIGFSLLANGLCEKLTLADVNPEAVRACEETIRENHLEDRVTVYQSDCLDQIPQTEQWDLVVSNPPHFDGTEDNYRDAIRLIDPGFVIHQKFYDAVARYLKPNASIIFQENAHATDQEQFAPMIAANGLKLVDVFETGEPRAKAGPKKAAARKGPGTLQKVMLPIERWLMRPRVEKLLKDNNLYRKLSALPIFTPTQFYFIWSQAQADAPSVER